jgi:tetratricopeptide (TPR) repeat protein
MKTEVWVAFIFGVVFLLISLTFAIVAFYLPKPANPEVVGNFLYVMQVVLAISASGVAAVIPGFLSVSVQKKLGKSGTLGIRAGGAIAVFVLVFVISPKSIALDQLNQRVGFNERLEKCRNYIPVAGSPMSGAIQYCLDARNFDPKRWEGYRQLARVYYWYGEYKDSIENYRKSILLVTGRDFEKINDPSQVKKDAATEFSLMSYGIAMAEVGLANSQGRAVDEKISGYRDSLTALEKSNWFMKDEAAPDNQFLNDVTYLEALDHAYIWLTKKEFEVETAEFKSAVEKFQQFLKLPGAVPQWAEYHLSCLYEEASDRSDSSPNEYSSKARKFIVDALGHLLRGQSDKSVVQEKLMQCRLLHPEMCQSPRGSEPMICLNVAKLVKGDPEVASLVASL